LVIGDRSFLYELEQMGAAARRGEKAKAAEEAVAALLAGELQ
jgi:hypothetical protein